MSRYSQEIAYNPSGADVSHKALTIRTISRVYNKEEASVHIVTEGDNLFNLAELYYDDFSKWYMIADKNPLITNPFILENGTEIIIPDVEDE